MDVSWSTDIYLPIPTSLTCVLVSGRFVRWLLTLPRRGAVWVVNVLVVPAKLPRLW